MEIWALNGTSRFQVSRPRTWPCARQEHHQNSQVAGTIDTKASKNEFKPFRRGVQSTRDMRRCFTDEEFCCCSSLVRSTNEPHEKKNVRTKWQPTIIVQKGCNEVIPFFVKSRFWSCLPCDRAGVDEGATLFIKIHILIEQYIRFIWQRFHYLEKSRTIISPFWYTRLSQRDQNLTLLSATSIPGWVLLTQSWRIPKMRGNVSKSGCS